MYELLPATAATKRMGPGSGAASTAGRRSTLVSTAAGDAARRPPTLGDRETMQDVQLSADVEALELRCNEPLRSRTTRLYSDKRVWHGSLPYDPLDFLTRVGQTFPGSTPESVVLSSALVGDSTDFPSESVASNRVASAA
ncbi:hypothetical protein EMIHUDRAFT_239919 [Emiliania huxleyi CCMP1516]|uniref:Uncharacterized protein n=2 Tax=Emiliania huxleyi TaxID=2903 RepID=A0A0D3JIE6_EMIH1|nr:hypothetical protein EMIHUDRAFT_239919 [Emiliania huxleyi CCMP1516]EOD23281.1 hypothetical protein EMIHUDRAFT_239919 [Emiliania huxleyi CCMP1516]|eukprot:XP_005775710.1 hypothetical protein EMIHUDRAFT_239919 [Emiliania huxleyi CCMP1516]